MSPCSPNDISIAVPDSPSGPSIPGFGTPFAINLPNTNPFPIGFPEDLLDLLDKLKLLIPSGALKAPLNLNFGKDVFDGIMKLLDQFMPFLMMYKFFLPILNIIICIIEVICAIPNPVKLVKAVIKLFRDCIPEFLNMFPMFALIIMLISLLLLLLTLIEYLVAQILKFINAVLKNVLMLISAFQEANSNSVLAIAKKLGSLMCIFQNLFVLLSIFATIIQVIKDILALVFAIPPCDDDNQDGCCTTDVCPSIVKNVYTRQTGTFQYLNGVGAQTDVVLPPPFGNFNYAIRSESWQLFDNSQEITQKFINIINAYDVPISLDEAPPFFKPIFFPTDVLYNAQTAAKQAAYTVDMRMLYNPSVWGRTGITRFIRFKDCIVTNAPSFELKLFDNSGQIITNGVLTLAGGKGYEDDGTTILLGFESDGITPNINQATLGNFIHTPDINTTSPVFSVTDGQTFTDIEYTFKPNTGILMSKNLITLGCIPEVAFNKNFVNNALIGDIALKTKMLKDLVNGTNFPNPNDTQQCLSTALSALRVNLTPEGVAEFQATTTLCLQKLKDDTTSSLDSLIGLGFDPCKSSFTITPKSQFTSKPITVKVSLNENNGISLISGIPADVASSMAKKIKGHISFGDISNFVYDGVQFFTADLTSTTTGSGQIMVSFDNNIFCTNTTNPPSHTLQTLDYQFVYTPGQISTPVGDGSDGTQPRRDEGDLSTMGDVGGKDGS